jgi:hypothetical protein
MYVSICMYVCIRMYMYVCVYLCMYVCTYLPNYLQVLPDLRNFRSRNFKYNFGSLKELKATRTKSTEFFLRELKRNETSGRILRGDNTVGVAGMLRPIRSQYVVVWISTGVPCSWLYVRMYVSAHVPMYEYIYIYI